MVIRSGRVGLSRAMFDGAGGFVCCCLSVIPAWHHVINHISYMASKGPIKTPAEKHITQLLVSGCATLHAWVINAQCVERLMHKLMRQVAFSNQICVIILGGTQHPV